MLCGSVHTHTYVCFISQHSKPECLDSIAVVVLFWLLQDAFPVKLCHLVEVLAAAVWLQDWLEGLWIILPFSTTSQYHLTQWQSLTDTANAKSCVKTNTHCIVLASMKHLTVEWSSGVWEVLGLLKKPCCGTRYSSASTASSMSSPLMSVRNTLLSVGLGRCMRSSPWNISQPHICVLSVF